jgi:hypothetical protein
MQESSRTQMHILLFACQISKFQNFHNFLNFHQPKGCFLSDRPKSPEFYALKNVNKKKAYSCIFFKKKERQRQQAPPSQKRSKKSILIFANFLPSFGSEYLQSFHGMTRNESAVFKVERRYGRKRAAIAAGRGAHLHANCSFSPPPALMAMKLPTIGDHI